MQSNSEIAMRVRVIGRVQGVGFRAWTQDRAQALSVRGWVRNNDDGTVAALLIGAEDAVKALLAEMEHGPRGASVREVAAQPEAIFEPQAGFQIAR
ncbi:acylphosphatase [Halovulum sp. GXIMD14794]